MSNKQEELEAIVQQETYGVIAITETWWDDSHDWSAAMGGYKLFRRDREGEVEAWLSLYADNPRHSCASASTGEISTLAEGSSVESFLAKPQSVSVTGGRQKRGGDLSPPQGGPERLESQPDVMLQARDLWKGEVAENIGKVEITGNVGDEPELLG
ncbi:hypothetical protein BTVI_52717 [Pitangus sulphuratus]|nr:hypothetical protein BTVI_52717 [Pitangus sulphuratus]